MRASWLAVAVASGWCGCASPSSPPSSETPPPNRTSSGGWVSSDPDANVDRPKRAVAEALPFERRNQTSPLGANLRLINYNTTDWPFVNLLRMGSPWVSRTTERWDDGRKLDRDENGAVRSLAPGQWAASLVPTVTGGKLALIWEGNGTMSVESAKEVLEQRQRRISFEAAPHGQVVINLTTTDPKDPVRNIAVVPEELVENHEAQLFHPLFLERLAPFAVIRFAEWQRIDGSSTATWEDRTLPTALFQSTEAGVAYEWQIELANRVDGDLWISIPHAATDGHVRKLAELLLEKLEPERRVFIEWSHEVWHDLPGLTQAQHALTQGLQAHLHPSDGNIARLRFQSKRSLQVFSIFEEVLKDRSRFVRVLASESGNAQAQEELLSHEKAFEHVDALAISAYFGREIGLVEQKGWLVKSSTLEVLEHLEKKSVPAALESIKAAAKIAEKYKVDLIAYEGGPYLAADTPIRDDAAVNAALDAVNRDPRMRRLTLRLLQGWREAGGKTFVYYAFAGAPGRWDRFGALEHIDQPIDAANKYDALLQFVEANPRWW